MKKATTSRVFEIPYPRSVGPINYQGMFELYLKEGEGLQKSGHRLFWLRQLQLYYF